MNGFRTLHRSCSCYKHGALKVVQRDWNVLVAPRLIGQQMETDMTTLKAFGVAALLVAASAVTPAIAQEVIENPGKCAQFYPNANCSNYGPGNPYRGGYGYYRQGWRNGYAWDAAPTYRGRRHHRDWR